ncbi:MAG: APC family permease [Solirubrobacterales bacterium]|nr:APC family permease [Solirubrobacterales bacterium]
MATPARTVEAGGDGPKLRRELRFGEAIALSLAIMAPTAAMALNGTAVAGLIGRAVPLAFIIATIGVLFVSYGFIRLTRHFNSAGSVFALAGATLGPRAGFFAGFALLATYVAFTIASAAEIGLFGQSFLAGIGLEGVDWLIIALISMIFVAVLAFGDIRVATRSLLGIEGLSVLLIVILMIVIFAKVLGGSAPDGQEATADVFSPPGGIPFSTVAIAAVFGFLSFGGFEGAASLGEETSNPGRNIPRAIGTAVIVAGTFYILCMIAQSLGFGATEAGAKRFSESESPLGDLSADYIGSTFSDLINFGATISAFAATLGAATAASRILFALSRDAFASNPLGRASARSGAPAAALTVVLAIALLALVAYRINGTDAVNAFFYPGTMGVLLLLVSYLVCNTGAIVYLYLSGQRRAPMLEVPIPVIAIAIILYVLYQNTVAEGLEYPYTVFPVVVAAWLLIGLTIALAVPGLARRIGEGLAREEGIKVAGGSDPDRR